MAPLVRTGGSRHTGLAALPHRNIHTYTTRTHDSLKISNGKWMWWSQRTGGRSALDYLIKVRGYSFLEAVELLAERANIQPSLSVSENVPMEKQLLLPKKNQDDQKVIAYLSGRGIDKEIIQFCLESGRVYESAFHHNAVFVGMDEKNNPKYAAIRGTGTSFIGEANGSDKNYSFSIFTEKPNDTMHLFESAIDLLSYATLQKLDGKEWRREHLLSLAGVYQPAKEIEKSKVPAALARALKMHPEVKTIVLHLDNDRIGRLATKAERLSSKAISGKRCTAKTRKRLQRSALYQVKSGDYKARKKHEKEYVRS